MEIRGFIFDCDGVIANSEPLHFEAFRKVLAAENIVLTEGEYYQNYLPFDDWEFFRQVYSDRGIVLEDKSLDLLVERKHKIYLSLSVNTFSGIDEVLKFCRSIGPVAIASGALRSEIQNVLRTARLEQYVDVIVAAEDVENSKPDPESFLFAIHLLNQKFFAPGIIPKEKFLIVEDSPAGISAASTIGTVPVGISHTVAPEELKEAGARFVVDSPAGLLALIKDLLFPDKQH